MSGGMAAWISAHRVPDQQRSALCLTHQTSGAAQRQNLAVLIDDRAEQCAVARMLLGRSGLNRTNSCDVAHRLGGPSRSCGNVPDAIHVGRGLVSLGGLRCPRRSSGNVSSKCPADTCTTTSVRSSPERSSGAVLRSRTPHPIRRRHCCSGPTPGAGSSQASPQGSGLGGGGPNRSFAASIAAISSAASSLGSRARNSTMPSSRSCHESLRLVC